MFESEIEAKTYALEMAIAFGVETEVRREVYWEGRKSRSREEINKLLMQAMKKQDTAEDIDTEGARPAVRRGKKEGVEIRDIEVIVAKGEKPTENPKEDVGNLTKRLGAVTNIPEAAPAAAAPLKVEQKAAIGNPLKVTVDNTIVAAPPAPPAPPPPPVHNKFFEAAPLPVVKDEDFAPVALPELTDDALSKINLTFAHNYAQQVQYIKQEIQRYNDHIVHQQREVDRLEAAMTHKSNAKELRQDLETLAMTGLWENFEIEGDKLWFTTTKDVYLSWGGKTLKFGKYAVSIGQGVIRICPFKDNIFFNRCYHPFISDGDVCWGQWAGPIQNEMAKGNLIDVAMSIHLLLNTYGPDGKGRSPMAGWTNPLETRITNKPPENLDKKNLLHPMQRR